MKKLILIGMATIMLLSGGCSSLYRATITVTELRKEVMNDLGDELRAGRISAENWQKVVEVDNRYRQAAHAARVTLEAYRDAGTGDPAAAMLAVKTVVLELINILASYQDVETERNQLTKAVKL